MSGALLMDDVVVRLYGKRESPQAFATRDYLQRSDVPFEWVELKDNEQARAELGLESVDDARLPICIFPRWHAHGATDRASSHRKARLVSQSVSFGIRLGDLWGRSNGPNGGANLRRELALVWLIAAFVVDKVKEMRGGARVA